MEGKGEIKEKGRMKIKVRETKRESEEKDCACYQGSTQRYNVRTVRYSAVTVLCSIV
jgi:hypothetical protein